jgi:transposase
MKSKKRFDARTLTHDALDQPPRWAVKRVGAGEKPKFVAAGLGLNRRNIYRWLTAYHCGGQAAIAAKPVPRRPPKRMPTHLAAPARVFRDQNPLQLEVEYALWTLAMIRHAIRTRFEVALSGVSVGRRMRRIGFTQQRPLCRA